MKISIVTPSFRNSEWLKLCIASVADQQGVEFEHIVQDAVSDDGTLDWLPADPRVKAFVEKDAGMYDAVNRGYRRAAGEILAYINCDEQYLPGALKQVHDYFEAHPGVDILVADMVVVASNGEYICHRPAIEPKEPMMWARFNVPTCSLFLRRRVIEDAKHFFDTRWRDLGDYFWTLEAVRKQLRFAVLPVITSAFTETGANMNLLPNALREREIKASMTPKYLKWMAPFLVVLHRLKMVTTKAYWKKPFDYEIYTKASPGKRQKFHVNKPTLIWPRPAI